uniref:Uncharacterized protein n=1 Tax=Arundo donax TaxID=35708 RepID=A0A0A8XY05_ARUDO
MHVLAVNRKLHTYELVS